MKANLLKRYIAFCILANLIHYIRGDLKSAYEYSLSPHVYTWFYLYPTLDFKDAQVLPLFNADILKASKFDRHLQTRILIHGFRCNKDSDANQYVLAAYLARGNFNVIIVDWSHGVTLEAREFGVAVSNTPLVGSIVAAFLDFLSETMYYPLSDVYIVGYSLGAHAAGFVGKAVRSGVLGGIIGLDPPLALNDTNIRLASSDAQYVEVIHTNYFAYGSLPPMGHADFYANGGGFQPGCPFGKNKCAHERAFKIFAESINNPTGFPARRCENIIQAMGLAPCFGDSNIYFVGGDPLNKDQRGIFHFVTLASRD